MENTNNKKIMIFNSFSPKSRVWVYQSSRAFTATEEITLQNQLQEFVQQWAAHGQALQAAAHIYHHQFIVLMVDENKHGASGCSIDSSVHFLKQLEQQYQVRLFDRLLIAYKDGDEVKTANQRTFKQLSEAGKINEETIVFNNLIQTKVQLEQEWAIPVANSWHKRLLVK